jgi:hypothetical protein
VTDPRHPDDDELLDPEARASIEEWGHMGIDDRGPSSELRTSEDDRQEAG